MKKRNILIGIIFLASCSSPPSQPASLWDSLPPAEPDAAKTLPSEIWHAPESPSDPAEPQNMDPVETEIVGTIVLNEIFYDSAESDTDGNLFVELFGTPDLPLNGFKIAFVNGSDGGVYDSVTIPMGAKVREDGFFVVADSEIGSSTASHIFEADLIDNFDPQNGPDAVQLLDTKGQLLDVVGYGESLAPLAKNGLASFEEAPTLDVAAGHSLERKAVGLDTDDNAADFMDQDIPSPGSSPE